MYVFLLYQGRITVPWITSTWISMDYEWNKKLDVKTKKLWDLSLKVHTERNPIYSHPIAYLNCAESARMRRVLVGSALNCHTHLLPWPPIGELGLGLYDELEHVLNLFFSLSLSRIVHLKSLPELRHEIHLPSHGARQSATRFSLGRAMILRNACKGAWPRRLCVQHCHMYYEE